MLNIFLPWLLFASFLMGNSSLFVKIGKTGIASFGSNGDACYNDASGITVSVDAERYCCLP